ncbi:MAG TPA: hypothetical protein VND64_25920 [Pirellulales bacterium]|nr:hypothetical protein [Pirellulales bacterium]
MKRIAMIATLLAAFFVSAAAPAKAGVFVRRPIAPVRTAVRVAAPPYYRPYVAPRVYARPGAYYYGYGVPYWGPSWGYGRVTSLGIGVY